MTSCATPWRTCTHRLTFCRFLHWRCLVWVKCQPKRCEDGAIEMRIFVEVITALSQLAKLLGHGQEIGLRLNDGVSS